MSIRNFLQYSIVDCLDVTIKTQNDRFAGTDHDIYLRVGQEWEWKLNEDILDGDLLDDFERGTITTYTIDPANGRPNRRLRLWQITEITLELRKTVSGSITEPFGTGTWKPQWIKVALNGQEVLNCSINKTLTVTDSRWTASSYPNTG